MLRGTKKKHRERRDQLMKLAQQRVKMATKNIEQGSCTKAYMNITEMWNLLGKSDTEGDHAGGTAFTPMSEIAELGFQFSQRCLRDKPVSLGGVRRRRRKR
jgi:hypothetical protein